MGQKTVTHPSMLTMRRQQLEYIPICRDYLYRCVEMTYLRRQQLLKVLNEDDDEQSHTCGSV